MNKHIYIYNDKLAFELNKRGHRFNTHARHIKTNKEFFQYDSSEQIRKDIEDITKVKMLNI